MENLPKTNEDTIKLTSMSGMTDLAKNRPYELKIGKIWDLVRQDLSKNTEI